MVLADLGVVRDRATEVRIEPATYLGHYLSSSARSTGYEGEALTRIHE